MQNYPYSSSFSIGQSFWMCVTPEKRFSIALFMQGAGDALIPMTVWNLAGADRVKRIGSANGTPIFQSQASTAPERFNTDWDWPRVEIEPPTSWKSGLYVAIAYEVNAQGIALDAIGNKIQKGAPIYPYPPDSDAMSLVVARPQMPANANSAYIIPVATYHAYNMTGGGCFYGYPAMKSGGGPFLAQDQVSERRPGGGLGALLGEPADYYDKVSPRQQAAHWDFKFVRWMLQNGLSCDFYTDKDLHMGTGALNLSLYQLLISVGHHEYWSQKMLDAAMTFLGRGPAVVPPPDDNIQYGNYACFSGNTCFRPISWNTATGIIKADTRSDGKREWPNNKEWELTGLSYANGGGRWGEKGTYFGEWDKTQRPSYGYKVMPGRAGSWVFNNTGLDDYDLFGDADWLVGYECDGRPDQSTMDELARSPTLAEFQDGKTNAATFGLMGDQPNTTYKSGVTFNAGTTDWARVLTGAQSNKQRTILSTITSNVLNVLSKWNPW